MRNDLMLDLADTTEFCQISRACLPRIVHGTLLLLAMLLGTALVWLAATQADLVVRAAGRVRPAMSTSSLSERKCYGELQGFETRP